MGTVCWVGAMRAVCYWKSGVEWRGYGGKHKRAGSGKLLAIP